ncbi:chemotaxis-specific protein-glutamate methyltransferase CheB [Aquipuribacter nitratireducens]|uniref:Protein-glutamate methylesterase/protein-glutamine glutaminase n=1 Tax=Aquipuribacter nitratireducens TaxID=650104 RepID=A0ABW0GMZ3_9MICO
MSSPRIRVVVVDDSVVVRRLVSDVLASDPEVEVVATCSNGRLGADAVRRLRPDVVTMDIEMPVMDGIQAVREIRTTDRLTPIIMFSTLTERGARATFDALDAGATDYVTKPGQASAVGSGLDQVRAELLPRVRALAGRRRQPGTQLRRSALRPAGSPLLASPAARAVPPLPRQGPPRTLVRRPQLVAVGSSTGGPEALSKVIGSLPPSFPVPVVVVQHMPAEFTQLLAERLDRTCAVRVLHAEDGQRLDPGTVVVARGGRHLEVVRDAGVLRTRLSDAPPENFCRPAVDVLFRSVARAVHGQCLAVVLTGMGSDGTAGAADLAAAGAPLWAQDEASSVVWGMPGSLVGAGLADAVLPLPDIGPAVVRAVVSQPGAVPPLRAVTPVSGGRHA